MASNPQPSASNPPPKPWERAGGPSGATPFKPPSAGSTSDVVEASGTAKPGEIVSSSERNGAIVNQNAAGRPVPARPWEQSYGGTGYNSALNYNAGYGSGMFGSYGGAGGLSGGGMYGNSMYRGGYGGAYGSGMYGGGLYGGGFGGPMGGYGMGMGGPYGGQDPNNPFGAPPSPPGFWMSVLRVLQGVLFDRSGMLYGELARFVVKLLGIRAKPRKIHPPSPDGLPLQGPSSSVVNQHHLDGPKPTPNGSWDNVWENDARK